MGFLEKSGTVKENFGGGRENHALRTVRAKRELDEADKEYRKGIHWLETLRLRKVKTLEGGYKVNFTTFKIGCKFNNDDLESRVVCRRVLVCCQIGPRKVYR